MKQFFKFVFASCLGVFLCGLLIFAFFAISMAIAGSGNEVEVASNSVLELDFASAVPERTNNVAAEGPDIFNDSKILGLQSIKAAIRNAADDNKIKGILIRPELGGMGFNTIEEIREELEAFKESGKFIYSYADGYSFGSYYLSSVADSVYLHPLGSVDMRGLSSMQPYMKEMLDKIGVKMEVFYVGKFKSATEPYRKNEMSDEARAQVREYLDDIHNNMVGDIAKSRSLSYAQIQGFMDNFTLDDADAAFENKVVDALLYDDEFKAMMNKKLGVEKKNKSFKRVSLGDYSTTFDAPKGSGKDRIAVIYAEGTIVDGDGENGAIGGDKYAELIRKARTNEKVKAIVLRVNSGGGSGFASEKIWRELVLAKEQGLPVIASMGDLAASGGYYISCMADTIIAMPNTLTGSIGVFGMFPNASELMEDRLGIHFDTVKTGKFAAALTPFYPVTEEEGAIIQNSVEDFYELFLKRVADGRSMERDSVHEIAQGRVWTGKDALGLGLVDEMGDLDDAIAIAQRMADLDEYKLKEYPIVKDAMTQFIEDLTGQKSQTKQMLIKEELGEFYPIYKEYQNIKNQSGVQARMIFNYEGVK